MSVGDIKDLLSMGSSLVVAVASLIAIIVTVYQIKLSLKEYRLKLEAEKRLAESARAESDIRLFQLFTEILYVASGRKGDGIFSKEIFDVLVQKHILTDDDFKDLDAIKAKVSQAAVIAQSPGAASANAAFASIATLAKEHPVLYESAIAALESFRTDNWNRQLSEKYLDLIRKNRDALTRNKAG